MAPLKLQRTIEKKNCFRAEGRLRWVSATPGACHGLTTQPVETKKWWWAISPCAKGTVDILFRGRPKWMSVANNFVRMCHFVYKIKYIVISKIVRCFHTWEIGKIGYYVRMEDLKPGSCVAKSDRRDLCRAACLGKSLEMNFVCHCSLQCVPNVWCHG